MISVFPVQTIWLCKPCFEELDFLWEVASTIGKANARPEVSICRSLVSVMDCLDVSQSGLEALS